MKPTRVTEEGYLQAVESYTGWCKSCKAFTTGSVEPDAEDFECESCGEWAVVGAEEALMFDLIVFGEDGENDSNDEEDD